MVAAPHGTGAAPFKEASSGTPRASLRTVGVELVRSSMLPRRRGASGLNRRSTILGRFGRSIDEQNLCRMTFQIEHVPDEIAPDVTRIRS